VTAAQPATHERAFELLPWLINGSLGPAERDAIELHVRTCIMCRRELKEQQQLRTAVRAQPTIHVSAQSGLERLDRQLDDGGAATRRKRYAAFTPFAVAAAAGVALLAFLLWLTPLPQITRDTYSTLATEPAAGTVLLDIVFAEVTTAADIQSLLDEIGGEIVAGPSDIGRYSVRLESANGREADAARVLATLARDPRVRLVTRSLSPPPP
jgi:hypothetical protein